jgi:PAS domain S-box-containing protein
MSEKKSHEEDKQSTERLNIELRKIKDSAKEIQALAKIGNWEWDIEQQRLIWSDEVYKIFGFEPSSFEPSAEAFEATIHPDDIDDFLKQREIMLADKKKACIDHRIVLPDGSIRYVQERTQLIIDSQNNVNRVIGTVQDITERKQAEEALKESETKYRALFENSLEAILLTAQDGSVYSANQVACEMLGKSESEIISGGRNGVVNLDDPRLPVALTERYKTGKFKGELTYKKKDGTIFPVELSSRIFHDRFGNEKTCISFRDISERKRVEEEREKLISELTDTLNLVKKLSGLLPICSHCKKIRDDKGYWQEVEAYIHSHSEARFSHSICRDCAKKHYPDYQIYDNEPGKN